MTRILGLTHMGLGRTDDGRFLARCLPGEEVEISENGAIRIVSPSQDRVSPPCRHYKSCGGCAMQHASDAFVADWKAGVVAKALAAQGLGTEIGEVVTSPDHSRRRAKFSGRRTKKGTVIGFHTRASDTLSEVSDCRVISPALRAGLPALEALTRVAASRKSEIGLTVTESLGGLDVHIDTEKELTPELRIELAEIAGKYGLARLVWTDEPIVTVSAPKQKFGRGQVTPPPGAFLQATQHGEDALVACVRKIVGNAKSVVDLFSGCGTFSFPLAENAEVHAVEGHADMTEALHRGWREAQGLKAITVEARDLFRRPLLPDELSRFGAAVIDPPRAGAEAQIAELASSGISKIAMVSCNPVTFARDARTLTDAGYSMSKILVVDQFRWSSHVEVVGGFERM